MRYNVRSIELTKSGHEGSPVWIPLDSIALVEPYVGFDSKVDGCDVVLNNNGSVQVKESYVTVIEALGSRTD